MSGEKPKRKISPSLIIAVIIIIVLLAALVYYATLPRPVGVMTTTVIATMTTTVKIKLPGEGMKIAFLSNGMAGDPFWAVAQKGAEDAGKIFGIEVVTYYYEGDPAKAADLMDRIIAARPSGIIVSDTEPAVLEPKINHAIELGIPVVNAINDDHSKRLAFFGPTPATLEGFLEQGYAVGKHVAHLIPNGSHILISCEFPAEPYARGRGQGFLNALTEAGLKFTYEILDAGYETAKTEARITEYLVAHPETKVAYSVGGLTTERTGVVVEKLGRKPGEIIVCGFDLLPETLTAIKKGYNKGVGVQQQYFCLFNAVVTLYNVIANPGFTPANYNMGLCIVDQTNVEKLEKLVSEGKM